MNFNLKTTKARHNNKQASVQSMGTRDQLLAILLLIVSKAGRRTHYSFVIGTVVGFSWLIYSSYKTY